MTRTSHLAVSVVAESLSKYFGPRAVLDRVTAHFEPGSMTALVGPSGSGKSTLLNCLGLLTRPDSGRVMIGGQDVVALQGGQLRAFRRDHLGYLFQSYALIDNASVATNIDIAFDGGRRRPPAEIRAAALERVGLVDRGDDPVHVLSGGEQQRVAMARLMVKDPTLILADEPTGALDTLNADMVLQTLREFADRGRVIIVATHTRAVVDACDAVFDVAAA